MPIWWAQWAGPSHLRRGRNALPGLRCSYGEERRLPDGFETEVDKDGWRH